MAISYSRNGHNAARLADATGTLSPLHREIVERHIVFREQQRDIAESLGMDVQQIRKLLREALQELRDYLEE